MWYFLPQHHRTQSLCGLQSALVCSCPSDHWLQSPKLCEDWPHCPGGDSEQACWDTTKTCACLPCCSLHQLQSRSWWFSN